MGFDRDVLEIFFNAMLAIGRLVQTISLAWLFTLIHLFSVSRPPLQTPLSWVWPQTAGTDTPASGSLLGTCILHLMVDLTVATRFVNSRSHFPVILVALGKSQQLYSLTPRQIVIVDNI